jgi:hypothetical protein
MMGADLAYLRMADGIWPRIFGNAGSSEVFDGPARPLPSNGDSRLTKPRRSHGKEYVECQKCGYTFEAEIDVTLPETCPGKKTSASF